jgi:3-hydroxyisobutyrate dehydrogenase-like beta-hydroxyacid dehydrogenase
MAPSTARKTGNGDGHVRVRRDRIRLALDAGRATGVPLPSARLADGMLSTAARLGYAHRNVAALFDVLARLDEVSEEERAA